MNQDKLDQHLRKEREIGLNCTQAHEILDTLERQIQNIEKRLTFFGRLLPFIQKKDKETLAELSIDIEDARFRCRKFQTELDNYFPVVQDAARDWLEEQKDSGYMTSLAINGIYGNAQRRLERFSQAVQRFLKSIGEARGAMSATYNKETKSYSVFAEERIREAVRVSIEVDRAVEDIARLNGEFASKSSGSIYSTIKLPSFGRAQYESKVREIVSAEIARAQLGFEQLLAECEQLRDKGIDEAYDLLRSAEGEHSAFTDTYVTQEWRKRQEKIMSRKDCAFLEV